MIPSEMPPILGIAEVVLNVRDLPKMKAFYQQVLGFSLVSEGNYEDPPNPNADPTITFLQIQPTSTPLGQNGHPVLLALIDSARHAAAKARFKVLKIEHSTLNHLAFEIPPETYQAHLNRLAELGLNPVEAEFKNMLAKAMFFRDPEDNSIELICHHPAAT
ncbi:MAG: VOC family protein [Fimbriimonadaceae bacterium]|nr:MAG: VOC family protein [Fimbriimonadaceae bacterium]